MPRLPFATLAAALGAIGAGPDAALAQHRGDIFLQVVDGRIETGRVEEDESITSPVVAFAGLFGDSGCHPFTDNPGFDSFVGTFEVGTRIGWNALDGWRVWNGKDGFEPTGGEFLEISFLAQSVEVRDDPVEGFSIAVQPDGGFHKHVDFCMSACPNGCTPPPDHDDGVYLLNLELFSTDPGVGGSEAFWIVFNYHDTEERFQSAFAWAEENLPAPPCRGDSDGSGAVDFDDLLAVLDGWGPYEPCPPHHPADFDESCAVDFDDLLVVLDAWGPCE